MRFYVTTAVARRVHRALQLRSGVPKSCAYLVRYGFDGEHSLCRGWARYAEAMGGRGWHLMLDDSYIHLA